jgi:hypothetical protein
MELFASLPRDPLNLVLEFYGKITYRNGEYINIISRDDPRYNMLSVIPIPRKIEYQYARPKPFLYSEQFENKLIFNNGKYEMFIWNISDPPNKILYFLYKPGNSNYRESWHRT